MFSKNWELKIWLFELRFHRFNEPKLHISMFKPSFNKELLDLSQLVCTPTSIANKRKGQQNFEMGKII